MQESSLPSSIPQHALTGTCRGCAALKDVVLELQHRQDATQAQCADVNQQLAVFRSVMGGFASQLALPPAAEQHQPTAGGIAASNSGHLLQALPRRADSREQQLHGVHNNRC